MKVLFLNYEYPPLGGGASVATEAILKQWGTQKEMEVHLVTAGVGKEVEHVHVGENVHVHRLPIGKDPSKFHSQSLKDIFIYTVKAWFFMRKLICAERKKKPFDITLAFFTVPCGFLAYLAKVFYGIPYVVSLRGADVPGFSEKYDTFYIFAKPLVRFLWRHAEKVIPNSLGIRKLAQQTNSFQLMEIIENGVDTESFQPKNIDKSMSPIVFLSTSRLTPRKGIHFLIEAFALAVKQSSVPIELHLIGEGEQKETLEARVKELGMTDKVQFLGRVEHYLLPQFYQKVHAFVLPSKNEGMSNSALEALACGLPLVVSGTGGMEELVTEGKNGCFIDPENTETFAKTLTDLATNQANLSAFGWESRRRAELRGWDKVAAHFKTALEQSIKKEV